MKPGHLGRLGPDEVRLRPPGAALGAEAPLRLCLIRSPLARVMLTDQKLTTLGWLPFWYFEVLLKSALKVLNSAVEGKSQDKQHCRRKAASRPAPFSAGARTSGRWNVDPGPGLREGLQAPAGLPFPTFQASGSGDAAAGARTRSHVSCCVSWWFWAARGPSVRDSPVPQRSSHTQPLGTWDQPCHRPGEAPGGRGQ